ncbi:MAG: hypothetical protein ACTHJ7_01280 [Candidatus Nitrosocosmicus sp.]
MAGWGLSLFQIISTLIGSGLTIFLLNSLSADINQPIINFNIVADSIKNNVQSIYSSDNLSYANSSNNKQYNITNPISNTLTKVDTVVVNNGRASATNLILGLYYPNGNITNFYTGFQSENVTFKKQSSNLLIAEANRLSKDSIIAITSIIQCNTANNTGKSSYSRLNIDLGNTSNLSCPPVNYFVTASYDQGSTFRTNIDSNFINMDKFYSFHFRDQILTIIMTFAVISFIISLSYKRLKRFKKRLSRPKFVFEIVKELVTIRDVLDENIMSKRIFQIDKWFSKDVEEKLNIFNDYADYYYLDDFYSKLKERAEFMSKKNLLNINEQMTKSSAVEPNRNNNYEPTSDKSYDNLNNKNYSAFNIKATNEQCLELANNAITNINWKNYQDVEDKKYYKPIAIATTVACAFLVSSIFEIYRITFFHYTLDVPSFYYRLTYIFFTTIVRAFIFFIIAREIINFQTLFAYEVGTTNNILSFFIMDRNSQVKLLLFSFIIGGIPILSILTNFHLISYEIQSLTIDPSIGYLLFVSGLLIDISMFIILVLVIPKFIMKTQIVKM